MRLIIAGIGGAVALLGAGQQAAVATVDSHSAAPDVHCVQQVASTAATTSAPHCFATYAGAISYLEQRERPRHPRAEHGVHRRLVQRVELHLHLEQRLQRAQLCLELDAVRVRQLRQLVTTGAYL